MELNPQYRLDAKRDLDDIGGEDISIYPLHKQPYGSVRGLVTD